MREFINYWLRLQHVSGFQARMKDKWIDAKPLIKQVPRWSILRNHASSDATEPPREH